MSVTPQHKPSLAPQLINNSGLMRMKSMLMTFQQSCNKHTQHNSKSLNKMHHFSETPASFFARNSKHTPLILRFVHHCSLIFPPYYCMLTMTANTIIKLPKTIIILSCHLCGFVCTSALRRVNKQCIIQVCKLQYQSFSLNLHYLQVINVQLRLCCHQQKCFEQNASYKW